MTDALQIHQVEDALDRLCQLRGGVWRLTLHTAADCCWDAEITVTVNDAMNADAERSLRTWAAGGQRAEDAATAALRELCAWLDQPDDPRLPVAVQRERRRRMGSSALPQMPSDG